MRTYSVSGLTHSPQRNSRAADGGGGGVAVVPCPGNSIGVGQKRLVFNVTNAAAAAAPAQPAAPLTQNHGSSSHYDAALYSLRDATAAAVAVRNSCVGVADLATTD